MIGEHPDGRCECREVEKLFRDQREPRKTAPEKHAVFG